MKNINSNNFFRVLTIVLLQIVLLSCADPDESPILVWSETGKGTFPRLVAESGAKTIDPLTIDSATYSWNVEFVNENDGEGVTSFDVYLNYTDIDTAEALDESFKNVTLFSQNTFTKNASGFAETRTFTVTAAELFSTATGLSRDSLKHGDVFTLSSEITMEDGTKFTRDNSSANVSGTALQGQNFRFTISSLCPTKLEDTYGYKTISV